MQTLLTEIEKYDGILIMATNRMFDLDEALHRYVCLFIFVNEAEQMAHLPNFLPYFATKTTKQFFFAFRSSSHISTLIAHSSEVLRYI